MQKEYEKSKEQFKDKSVYDVDTAYKYINDQIKKFDWNTYIVAPYYPSKVRDDFMCLNFYNLELMRIPESTRESSLALGKLNFWEDSLD